MPQIPPLARLETTSLLLPNRQPGSQLHIQTGYRDRKERRPVGGIWELVEVDTGTVGYEASEIPGWQNETFPPHPCAPHPFPYRFTYFLLSPVGVMGAGAVPGTDRAPGGMGLDFAKSVRVGPLTWTCATVPNHWRCMVV